uniref:Uncharacterized protein n=1 Tax=Romanomermis culicivorax TaxID=13658 RepID=A0A915I0K7_ROMCU
MKEQKHVFIASVLLIYNFDNCLFSFLMDYIYAIRDNFRKRFDEIAEAQNDLFVCSNLEGKIHKFDENLKIPPNLDFSLKNSDATFVVPSKFETKNCDSDEKEENLRPKFVENKQKLQIEYLNEEEFKNIPSYMK